MVVSANTARGWWKAPTRFLPCGEVDRGLAADRGIDHRQQGGGQLHEAHAAHPAGGREAGEVADHAAAEREHGGVAAGAETRPAPPSAAPKRASVFSCSPAGSTKVCNVLAGERRAHACQVQRRDVVVADHAGLAAAHERRQARRIEQAGADLHRCRRAQRVRRGCPGSRGGLRRCQHSLRKLDEAACGVLDAQAARRQRRRSATSAYSGSRTAASASRVWRRSPLASSGRAWSRASRASCCSMSTCTCTTKPRAPQPARASPPRAPRRRRWRSPGRCPAAVPPALRLAGAEAGFALELEDQRDAGAGALFEHAIDVDEVQPEPRREATTERALAGAHRADQDQVGRRIHGAGS